MIFTEFWAVCICGGREQVESPDTYPSAWPVMIDVDGKHYACTRGCLILLMADPAAGQKQIVAPLPIGIGTIDLEMLRLVAFEYGNKEIGRVVYLSPDRVKNRLTMVYRALGAKSRTGALLLAHAHGLINLPRIAQEYVAYQNAA